MSVLRGTIRFDLENAIEADIDEVCDMDTRFYQFHIAETEQSSSEAVQTGKYFFINQIYMIVVQCLGL